MPAKSQKQRKLFAMVYAYKKGQLPNASKKVKEIAKGVTLKQAEDFAKKVQQELEQEEEKEVKQENLNRIKLMDLISENKVIYGKDYKIVGFADRATGNMSIKIISNNPQILKGIRTKDFAEALAKVYKGGVKIDNYYFRRTFILFAFNSYDTSQTSLQKVMNILKNKIQNIQKF